MIPGRALHRLAFRLCNRKTLEQIVEPAIADLQKEYRAIDARQVLGRVHALLAGYFAILKVIAMCVGRVSVDTDEERRHLVTLLAWSAAMVAVFIVLLMVPPVVAHPRMGWQLTTTLVPQAMGLAIPIGIAFGMAFGVSGRPTLNIAKATLLGAVAASALSFVILAWGIPAGGDAFRNITFRELRARGYEGPTSEAQKGYSEMTLSELRSQEAHFAADGVPVRARQLRFAYHFRFAFAAATLALVSFLLVFRIHHRGARGVLAFTVCLAYWMLMFAGDLGSRRGYLPVPIGAWLPNIVLIASAIFIASSSSSSLRGPKGVVQ